MPWRRNKVGMACGFYYCVGCVSITGPGDFSVTCPGECRTRLDVTSAASDEGRL